MANIFLCSYFAEVASKINEVVDFQGKHVAFIDTAAKFEEVNFYVDEAVKILEKFEPPLVVYKDKGEYTAELNHIYGIGEEERKEEE